MRTALVLSAALSVAALGNARAQCTPQIQKLIDDKKYDDARGDVQALIKRNDRDDAALHCMGRIYADQDKGGEATEWFEKAIKVNDQVAIHHLWLGNAIGSYAEKASKIKQPFLARRIKSEFERAAQLDPSSIDARHGLIQFYSRAPGVMGGSMDKAKEQAREIGRLNAWRGHWELAQLLERDKDLAGAEKEFQAAVSAAPDTNATHLYLASFYRRQKRWESSLATYENLLKRKPDAINTRLNIAYTLYQAGTNPDRAEKETRAWLAAPPADAPKANFSVAHFLLGYAAEKQGKKDAARAEYQQSLSFNPANGDAKKALESLR